MKIHLIFAVPIFILLSCSLSEENSNSEPTYPTLVREDLIGCWRNVRVSNNCAETCYSRDNSFYSVTISELYRTADGEMLGKYRISDGSIYRDYTLRRGVNDIGDSGHSGDGSHYWVLRDTLWISSINADQSHFTAIAGVRVDSSTACRPHWNYFTQPTGWDISKP